ncbi:MAG: biotin-dependent carboxyltransferase family protein [Pseudomonadota bacterium]|nr:biotin-dependent carboxyltransferase family protein [Pseudomonadota bacterium]
MTAALAIDAPGLMTTVQDAGRPGYQYAGVPVSGALDTTSFRLTNIVVGNDANEACLEFLFQGPAATVEADSVRLAAGGSGACVELLGGQTVVIGSFQSVRLERGSRFRISPLTEGGVGYLAVQGGLEIGAVLGSRSTYMRGGFGGLEGRALRAGDRVFLAQASAAPGTERYLPIRSLPVPDKFRLVMGPQDDRFTAEGIATLLSGRYKVTTSSDRMGFRLEGPTIEQTAGFDIVSDGIAPGAIQVPGSGQPIVLLADRGTTGGYTKIANVISADLPAFGRLRPGDSVMFEKISREGAEKAAHAHGKNIEELAGLITDVPEGGLSAGGNLDENLLNQNLVSGVFDAHEP